ncbi:MAG: STAS domain-containing protein [Betaproteobacteria bacterium]|nr:STAS domain-containing protein [Betaproteobacteria bacterium]
MLITPKLHGTTRMLSVNGRLDQDNCEAFRAELAPFLQSATSEPHHIVLDLSGLEYVSSAGLRCFMLAARQARGQDSRIVVAALQPMVAEIFQISRFDLVLKVYADVEAALTALAADSASSSTPRS